MEKIYDFEAPREGYSARATVVWCIDWRYAEMLENYLRDEELTPDDQIKVAGGIKNLVSPENPHQKESLISEIQGSIELHDPDQIILMAHEECGAYGGKTDREFYTDQLKTARAETEKLLEKYPAAHPTVRTIFADFDGLWELPNH